MATQHIVLGANGIEVRIVIDPALLRRLSDSTLPVLISGERIEDELGAVQPLVVAAQDAVNAYTEHGDIDTAMLELRRALLVSARSKE